MTEKLPPISTEESTMDTPANTERRHAGWLAQQRREARERRELEDRAAGTGPTDRALGGTP